MSKSYLLRYWVNRLRYAWRRHGFIGLIPLLIANMFHVLRNLWRRPSALRADRFDEEYDFDTRGVREIGTLDAAKLSNARYAEQYSPSSASGVRAAIAKLNIDPCEFTFLDFGSGKGRVLLTAAEFPFSAVIGIEFSHELHVIACQNIARLPSRLQRAVRVNSTLGDAGSFVLPDADLVCYFYNPFGPPVLSQVVARLRAHGDCGYRVIVIYVDPRHRALFEGNGAFGILDETPHAVVFAVNTAASSDDD